MSRARREHSPPVRSALRRTPPATGTYKQTAWDAVRLILSGFPNWAASTSERYCKRYSAHPARGFCTLRSHRFHVIREHLHVIGKPWHALRNLPGIAVRLVVPEIERPSVIRPLPRQLRALQKILHAMRRRVQIERVFGPAGYMQL